MSQLRSSKAVRTLAAGRVAARCTAHGLARVLLTAAIAAVPFAEASTPVATPVPALDSIGEQNAPAQPELDVTITQRLPYYTDEELSVINDASHLGQRASQLRAAGDWKAWAKDVRGFLDATGELQEQGAVALAVAYGTQSVSDLIAAATSQPSYKAASDILEIMGDRLGRRWFPERDFENQLRSILTMFENYHDQMVTELRAAPNLTGRLEVARKLVHKAAGIDVPKKVVYDVLRTDLDPTIDSIKRTNDARAAQIMLEDPDLAALLVPPEERRFRKIVADYQTGGL